jgi:hypothetical protein
MDGCFHRFHPQYDLGKHPFATSAVHHGENARNGIYVRVCRHALQWRSQRNDPDLGGAALQPERVTLAGGLFVFSYLAQIFQTQIETSYFLSAFPPLHGNLEVYRLFLRGAITSAVFVLLVTLFTGGFFRKPREAAKFIVHTGQFVKVGAWLAAVYFILYILFGYYVAWQAQELRLFYGGSAELNSFVDQILKTLMSKPEMPFFQYARGILWIVCLIPLFKGFTGGRVELLILSGLALALLPTMQLAFPNPLMPAGVSLGHFWETSISTGIFGALCA